MADLAKVMGLDVPAGAAAMWTLAETLSPTAAVTINSSVFAVHDLWMIILDVYAFKALPEAESTIDLRFNDNAIGANYGYRIVDAAAVVIATATGFIRIGTIYTGISGVHHHGIGQILVTGKGGTAGGENSTFGVTGVFGGSAYNKADCDRILNGYYVAQTTDLTKFNFLFQFASTGKIKIYYMDY